MISGVVVHAQPLEHAASTCSRVRRRAARGDMHHTTCVHVPSAALSASDAHIISSPLRSAASAPRAPSILVLRLSSVSAARRISGAMSARDACRELSTASIALSNRTSQRRPTVWRPPACLGVGAPGHHKYAPLKVTQTHTKSLEAAFKGGRLGGLQGGPRTRA